MALSTKSVDNKYEVRDHVSNQLVVPIGSLTINKPHPGHLFFGYSPIRDLEHLIFVWTVAVAKTR